LHPQDCGICQGRSKIQCSKCNGAGKLPSNETDNWPIDKLRFEYGKRQRESSQIQTNIHHLEHEERIQDELYDEGYGKYQDIHGDAAVGPYDPPSKGIRNQTCKLRADLHAIQMEMEAIEKVLNERWQ
jgi:hypothetical protein